MIEEKYCQRLKIPYNNTVEFLPSHLALCTVINAGSKGELDYSLLNPARKYMEEKGWVVNGNIYGKILLRTHKNGRHCRYFEMKIPVKRA